MKWSLAGAAMVGLVAAEPTAALADQVNYNTQLANGVYFGSDNQNTNFTLDINNVIELGLSTVLRYIGPVVPIGSPQNVYIVPTGETTI